MMSSLARRLAALQLAAVVAVLAGAVANGAIIITAGPEPAGNGAIIIAAGPEPAGKAEVQNMIQNSEQRSWCRPGVIRQIVTHDDCDSQEVENHVCAGSCFSYSLPQTQPDVPGDEILDFCESCQPAHSTWINVTLQCVAEDESTYEVYKRVQQITNCSCSSCPGTRHHGPALHNSKPSYEENHRISELLYRALPHGQKSNREPSDSETGQHVLPPPPPSLPITLMMLTTPAALHIYPSTSAVTPSNVGGSVPASTSTPSTFPTPAEDVVEDAVEGIEDGDILERPAADSPSPEVYGNHLQENDSQYEELYGPSVLMGGEVVETPENEFEFNMLNLGSLSDHQKRRSEASEPHGGIAQLVTNLNAILKGRNSFQYRQHSMDELKTLLQNMGPQQRNELAVGSEQSATAEITQDNP